MKRIIFIFLCIVLTRSLAYTADTLVIGGAGTHTDNSGNIVFGDGSTIYDANTNRFGLGTTSPTHQLHIKLRSDDNFYIDGRTNPRDISLGVWRIEHTPAITGTRPITFDINAASFGDTRAITTNYVATGLDAQDIGHLYDATIDSSDSTGGNIAALYIDKIGAGSINVVALEVRSDINVIEHIASAESSATGAFKRSGATFTNATTAFSSTGTNTQIFTADDDYIYIGQGAIFKAIKVMLSVFASGGGISPTFEYSLGGGSWQIFSPADGTNGFRTNGSISWMTLTSWATDTVVGSVKYWIRIQRTRNSLATPPTESKITTTDGTVYAWDKLGAVNVNTVSANNLLSGTYTPTLTNIANLDGSTSYQAQYMRVGNVVTVSGKINTDPTNAGQLVQLGISLPIASDVSANEKVSGVCNASGHTGIILGDATNNRAEMQETPGITTAHDMYFTFTYLVQ